MSNKSFFIIITVLIVAVLGGAILFTNNDQTNEETTPADISTINENDHVKGDSAASVVFVEYGDFQCPFCAAVHPILEEVLPEYEDDVAFVYRHFPITSSHPNALVAHKAAEAAGQQDKFWEMHDLLFENQAQWSAETAPIDIFRDYARQLELDIDQFNQDFDSSEVLDTVNSMKRGGEAAGVNSTPSFFINGEKVDPPRSADELREILDQAITDAN